MNNSPMQKIARYGLGTFLVVAGIGHLTFARKEFQAQVPDWAPISKDNTVVYSGFVEIALGAALILAPAQQRAKVGKIAAAFFTAVFPGNIAQYKDRRDGFGLDTDGKRLARLFFQPVLVAWALKSTSKR
ncbi:hypothetical protein [Sphingobacterium sp.]|uniref:DoxX family protein n=1 Tax=Sphingobacterium sp. TaxID=341027 RepID=UPI0031DECAD0